MSIRDELARHFGTTFGNNPEALMIYDANPIAPSMPKRGVVVVSSCHATTKNVAFTEGFEPEGWDQLVADEAADKLWPFVVVHDPTRVVPKTWCVRLNDEGYKPLYARPWVEQADLMEFVTVVMDMTGCLDDYDDW